MRSLRARRMTQSLIAHVEVVRMPIVVQPVMVRGASFFKWVMGQRWLGGVVEAIG